jgi:hypothetical protein
LLRSKYHRFSDNFSTVTKPLNHRQRVTSQLHHPADSLQYIPIGL